jgi:hypothetical protein
MMIQKFQLERGDYNEQIIEQLKLAMKNFTDDDFELVQLGFKLKSANDHSDYY